MTAMTFEEWCDYKKSVMGQTPVWFRDPAERLRRYKVYAAAANACCVGADSRDQRLVITRDAPARQTVVRSRSYHVLRRFLFSH